MKTLNTALRALFIFLFLFTNYYYSHAANYYWVGGTGNWSDYGNHWATTSGGVIFHTTIPSPLDDVYFDGNSFTGLNDTVYLDSTLIYCKSMDWTGAINSPVLKGQFNTTINLFGSLTFIASMKLINAGINFESNTAGNTITSGGQSLGMTFMGSGEWGLMDSLSFSSILLYGGSLNTNSHNLKGGGISYTGSNAVNFQTGNSVITLYNEWQMTGSNLTLDASQSTISCDEFKGGNNHVYKNITAHLILGDTLIIDMISAYDDISMAMPEAGKVQVNHSTVQLVHFDGWGSIFGNSNIFQQVVYNDIGDIYGNNNTIHYAYFPDVAGFGGSNTIDSVIISSPSADLSLSGSLTITDLFSASGSCNGLKVIKGGGTLNKISGSVIVDYVFLQGVNATGGASFIANNSVDDGNVTGWTVNSPAGQNLYWVGGTGNWNDVSHWSTSSGGSGGSCLPSPFDNVFFDANSFTGMNDTVFLNQLTAYCKNMDWTGATNNPVLKNTSSNIRLYGSLTLIQAMNVINAGFSFDANTPGNTITSAGQRLWLSFVGSGEWDLMDSLDLIGMSLSGGSLNTNNHSLNGGSISCTGSNAVNFQAGTSVITLYDYWEMTGSNLTLDASQATIFCEDFKGGSNHIYKNITAHTLRGDSLTIYIITAYDDTSAFFQPEPAELELDHSTVQQATYNGWGYLHGDNNYFEQSLFNGMGDVAGDNNVFHYVQFTDRAFIGGGNNSIDSVIFNSLTAVVSLNGTLTITDLFSANGSCSGLKVIQGGTINKTSGSVILDYVFLQGISATGGASFTANNSIEDGSVTGWTVNSPASQNLYWVGGTGNWNDVNHWAVSSGGSGGSCMPTPFDNVYFDANSFTGIQDTIYLDDITAYCNNMDWTAATNNPVVYVSWSSIWLFGSLTLIPAMEFISGVNFKSDSPGNTVTTGGQQIWMDFMGSGEWDLMDSVNGGAIILENGSLRTNNNNIFSYYIGCTGSNPVNFDAGTSVIKLTGDWEMTGTNLTLDASQTTIICDEFKGGTNHVYNDIFAHVIEGDSLTITRFIAEDDSAFSMPEPGEVQLNHSNVQQAIFYDWGYTVGNNNTFQQTIFYGFGSIGGGNNTFQHLTFTGQPYLGGSIVVDTLLIYNAGGDVSITGAITINHVLQTNAMAGFPISFSGAGQLSTPTGNTICLDYLYIQDIDATGGGTFYAGDHSVDLGNNSGWIWSGCTPDTSNVWPGDANYDLTADNIDILYIGLAYGYTGPVRAGATTNWVSQPGIDWLQQFATGYNIKHADCDGNGLVDASDTVAVTLNYGQVHPFKQGFPPTVTNFGTPLYFDLPTGPLMPGSTVDIPIMLGTVAEPADMFYGVAFTVNYDPSMVQQGSMEIIYNSTWFGNGTNTIHLSKDDYNNGTVDMAFVKNDHQNEAGYGAFATLHFTLANVAGGALNLSFSKILALDKFEIPQPVNVTNGSISTGVDDYGNLSAINIYPNPVKDVLQISVPNQTIKEISLISMEGKKVLSQSGAVSNRMNVGDLADGVYLLEVKTANGLLRKKLLVSK